MFGIGIWLFGFLYNGKWLLFDWLWQAQLKGNVEVITI
jgi:hypothetical protein